MIHYTCDRCQRLMDPEEGPRYVVQIDVHAVACCNEEMKHEELMDYESVDYLNDLHEMLESQSHGVSSEHGDEFDDAFEDPLDYLNELMSRSEDCGIPHGNSNPGSLPPVKLPPAPSSSAAKTKHGLPHGIELDEDSLEEEDCTAKFDLCPACYVKYSQNPLSRDRDLKLHFSNN